MGMDPGFPKASDFESEKKVLHEKYWEFKRDAMEGGKNYGEDFLLPQGSVLVDYEMIERGRFNTKGNPDIRLVSEQRGLLSIPRGVHNGIRLTPDSYLGGSGASYTGDIKMTAVSESDWYEVIKDQIL